MAAQVKKIAALMSSTQEQRECRFRNEHGKCCRFGSQRECTPRTEKDFDSHMFEKIQMEDVCAYERCLQAREIITSEDIEHLKNGGVLYLDCDDIDLFIYHTDSHREATKP